MKTVLVTGASGDIGRSICLAFAEKGYNIIAHYNKNKEAAHMLCSQLEEKYSVKTACFGADFSNVNEVKILAENVEQSGGIDVLVNNAGMAHIDLFQNVTAEKVNEIFNVNIISTVELTKHLIGGMINKKSGAVINISSMWGVSGGSCEVHYSATKAAMIGFTKSLCKEVGPSGITVNCIAPGFIDTKMNGELSEDDVKAIVDETPLMRTGKCTDVAALAVFLASEEASFITGQVISVDGGLSV